MRWLFPLTAFALVACSGEASDPAAAAEDSGVATDSSVDTGKGPIDSARDDTTTVDTLIPDTATPEDSFTFLDTSAAVDTFVADTAVDTGPIGSGWTPLPATTLAARRSHTAVWGGSSMIVWGGCGGSEKPIHGDGASYDPTTSTWKVVKDAGLLPRYLHAAAWSGTEMLVIGGITASGPFGYTAAKDGALYDPATDTWSSPISLPGSARYSATAVWSTTTNEFLVWGGFSGSANLNDGYAYKPSTKTWRTLSAASAPSARNAHAAAWNGTKMILIGGGIGGGYANDAFAYDPVTDTWASIAPPAGYSGRNGTTPGLANGSKVAFWGGRASFSTTDLRGDGLFFDGTAVTMLTEPAATILPNPKREGPTGWWLGDRLYVWGGRGSEGWAATNTGASFDPASKTWSAMPSAKAPSARYYPTAVVNPTSGHAYVWGGYNGTVAYADGAIFKP